ncbi:multiple coagulation factor deficiency protein 2 homolog isoform X2 [Artemia franciscana]|uniref:multiple coagulation factor deficiency protein 2 homolog isoform X2 n=1 Tax=Artemia franciscana TaxID=6661 RepID=UPI0032DB16B3
MQKGEMISTKTIILFVTLQSVSYGHGPGFGYGSHSHMKNPGQSVTMKPHEHYRPNAEAGNIPGKITRDTKLVHDEDHLQEDLAAMMPDVDISKLTPEEKDFYYFKLHDYDGNLKLDGLELYSAISHILPEPDFKPRDTEEEKNRKLEEIRRINNANMQVYVSKDD